MPNVTFAGMSYACTKAIKGHNYIDLLDAKGVSICRFDEVKDFSAFSITDGEWSDPPAVQSVMATDAVLTEGSIVLTTDPARHVGTGTMVKFNAPCDCTAVTGGLVINGVTYAVVNTMGETATGTGSSWCSGAQVAVIIDSANSRAFFVGGSGGSSSSGGLSIKSGTFTATGTAKTNIRHGLGVTPKLVFLDTSTSDSALEGLAVGETFVRTSSGGSLQVENITISSTYITIPKSGNMSGNWYALY